MEHEAGTVDRMPALDHAAAVIGKDQVGHLHLREVHGHRVGPVQVRMLRFANRQMPGESVVEAVKRESAAGGDQSFLEVSPLGNHIEDRQHRKLQARWLGLID